MGITPKPPTNSEKILIASMPHIQKCFDTKIGALAFGDLEILSDLGRDIHTYVQ